jgi:uncharacterized integral membrane protein
MIFNTFIILLLSIIVAIFAVSNSAAVSVNLVFWQANQVSLAIVILVSALIGIIFVGLIYLYQKIKDGLHIFRLESKIKELENRLRTDKPE